MKTLMAFLIAISMSSILMAQETGTVKQDTKPDKQTTKAQREARQMWQFNQNMALIDSMQFVIEADYLMNRYGEQIPATSVLNFVLVDSTQAVLQSGRNAGMGANGVGGLTVKGNINSWVVERNVKKKIITARFNVTSPVGYFNVFIYLPTNGNATASVSGSTISNRIDFVGRLVPLRKSHVYQGRSL